MIGAGEDPAALPGVGARIAGYLRELVDAGSLTMLEELRRSFPPGLVALTRLPGLGPKKAAALWEALEIGSIEELEAALKDGRVATVRGFGAASASKLLEAIAATRDARERTLRTKAERRVAGL